MPDTLQPGADRTLTLTRTIPAPRSAVWAAWTDPARLPLWWGPRGFTCRTKEIDIREGGVWRFDMIGPDGTVFVNRHSFRRIVPETAIDYLLDDDGTGDHRFDAFVRFADAGHGTEVSLRMVFPDAATRRAVEDFGAVAHGYTTLDCLAEAALPGPALSLTRLIAAPQAAVWAAWTEPRRMAHWYFPDDIEITGSSFDPLQGGAWRTGMRHTGTGETMQAAGEITAVQPMDRIAFTHGWLDEDGAPGARTLCEITLAPLGPDRTRLTFVQTGLTSPASRDGHAEGWGQALDHLADYLERSG